MHQTPVPFMPKLPHPCKRFLQQLRLPSKRSLSAAFGFRHLRHAAAPKLTRRRRIRPVLPFLCRWSSIAEMDDVEELISVPDTARGRAPVPSPLTPAYARRDDAEDRGDVEEACRSFENYLVEMIVEEGEARDLRDVEELLHCWGNLKDPVFVGLVSRFYGELCKDLFSEHEDEVAE